MIDSLIPDGITPVCGWRGWTLRSGQLRSGAGDAWVPLRPLEARCAHGTNREAQTIIPASWLRQPQPNPTSYYATGSSYPTRKPETEAEGYRLAVRPGPHGTGSHPVVHDEDTGERFIPFGASSRLIVRGEPKPTQPSPSPAENCTCGIYAASDIDTARSYGNVIGRVALWGRVIVHDLGWRGQFAYPQSFFTDDKKMRSDLEQFQVPILPLSRLTNTPEAGPPTEAVMEEQAAATTTQSKRTPIWRWWSRA